jgi:hypothetical protein
MSHDGNLSCDAENEKLRASELQPNRLSTGFVLIADLNCRSNPKNDEAFVCYYRREPRSRLSLAAD